jgi:hypothetical protein
MKTIPEASLTCAEFEEHLTDYLMGFDRAALSPLGTPCGPM